MIQYPALFLHGNFPFNAHLNADGSANEPAVFATTVIDQVLQNPAFRDLRDPYHLTQGGQLGRVHKGMRVLQINGRIVGPEGATREASLSDTERRMRAAFDPSICYRDSPSSDGAYQFQFTEPTLDTANYANGRIPLQHWLRPIQQPFIADERDDAGSKPFRLALLAADPRAYDQTEQTLSTLTSGSVVNLGNTAAPLKVTVTMNGAGSSTFTITRASVACIFNLSGFANNDVLIVVMETCAPYGRGKYITKNGTENAPLKTSAASTWLDVPTGSTTFTLSNTTNVRSCVLAWYSARA